MTTYITPVNKERVVIPYEEDTTSYRRLRSYLEATVYQWHDMRDIQYICGTGLRSTRAAIERATEQNMCEWGLRWVPGYLKENKPYPVVRKRSIQRYMRVRTHGAPRGIMGTVLSEPQPDQHGAVVVHVCWGNGQEGLCDAGALCEVIDGFEQRRDWHADLECAKEALFRTNARTGDCVGIYYISGHGYTVVDMATTTPHVVLLHSYMYNEGLWEEANPFAVL